MSNISQIIMLTHTNPTVDKWDSHFLYFEISVSPFSRRKEIIISSEILQREEMPNSTSIDKARGVDIIRLPKLSEMMESARVVDWKVKEGSGIKKGDIIAEVETDKAIIEVESFREGTVLYLSKKATTSIKENEILIIVGEKGAYIQNILDENGLK